MRVGPGAEANTGEQLAPARVESPTTRETQLRCGNSRRQQRLEPLPNGKGDALQRGAEQVTARVRESQPNPGTSRIGIELGRAFAG